MRTRRNMLAPFPATRFASPRGVDRHASVTWPAGVVCLASLLLASLLLASLCLAASPSRAEPLAFPGAMGFGASSAGGRGGDVAIVTHLGDAGPGSLRDAIDSAVGPRTIVFETSGTIDLQSPLVIDAARLTIAGQTAPAGIGTRGYPVLVASANDVVIRFMRFRTGDINAQGVFDKPPRGNGDLAGDAGDGLSVVNAQRVILDHVSASWGMDETLSVTVSSDVTVQHSLIGEALNDSYHQEGLHGYGSLIRGTGVGGYSLIGNLWAHHTWRSPAIGGFQNPEKGQPRPGLDVDVVNNVVYDWKTFSSHTVEGLGTTRLSFQANLTVAGPSTDPFCQACAFTTLVWDVLEGDEMQIHHADNWIDADRDADHDPVPVAEGNINGRPWTNVPEPFVFSRPEFEVLDAQAAYQRVIDHVGASIGRDEVDARIVAQLVARTGGVIDSQDDVGGWPEPGPQIAPLEDLDRDGMGDDWESFQGLDPADPNDRNDHDLDPDYTNLEVYLAERATLVPEPGEAAGWLAVAGLLGWRSRRTALEPPAG